MADNGGAMRWWRRQHLFAASTCKPQILITGLSQQVAESGCWACSRQCVLLVQVSCCIECGILLLFGACRTFICCVCDEWCVSTTNAIKGAKRANLVQQWWFKSCFPLGSMWTTICPCMDLQVAECYFITARRGSRVFLSFVARVLEGSISGTSNWDLTAETRLTLGLLLLVNIMSLPLS